MNVNRLRATIELLLTVEQQYNIQSILDNLSNELQQVVNQPQQAQFQTSYANTLNRLRDTFASLWRSFSPAQWVIFDEIKASEMSSSAAT